jgi:alpha-1,3-rhamnosyl/mannosyltransferase
MRVAWFYDLDACRNASGVTRHALAQLEGLRRRPECQLSVVTGRIKTVEGLTEWEKCEGVGRAKLPLRTRDALRYWRQVPYPTIERFSGRVDWVYCPAELFVPTRRAKRAVTSHDVLQDRTHGGPARMARLASVFDRADLILSVSAFNTRQLLEHWPRLEEKVELVPNGAEELFFEHVPGTDRSEVRPSLGLPEGMPYLVSVANFQARKNLGRLVRAVGRLAPFQSGELALVLVGDGSSAERAVHQAEVAQLGPSVRVVMPGYRQGEMLRAIYGEATALVFPSLCESFGIPAVEAMAVGCPVAVSNTTALPEIVGEAGWYFDPEDEASIANRIREMLDQEPERRRRVVLGRERAEGFRWGAAAERLWRALESRR